MSTEAPLLRKLDQSEQFVCWHRNGVWRTFPSFTSAERYAQRTVVERGEVEITRGTMTVAHVRTDALDRVWTDVVATDVV